MLKWLKGLFGKPTMQDKLTKAMDDAIEAQINAEINAVYHAHMVSFHKSKLEVLDKWRV